MGHLGKRTIGIPHPWFARIVMPSMIFFCLFVGPTVSLQKNIRKEVQEIGWENHFCSLLLALSPRKHRTITQRISSFLWPGLLQKRKSCLAREKIIFLEKRKWKSHVYSSQPNIWQHQRGRSDRSLQCVVLLDFR